MPRKVNSLRLKTIFISALISVLFVGIPALGDSARDSFPSHNNLTISTAQGENIEAEVITATANGLEPAVITRPHGPFVLAVHNRSGDGELVFRLTRAQDGQLNEVRLRAGRRRQHQRLDLPPGEYILSEVSHPTWRCQILITR